MYKSSLGALKMPISETSDDQRWVSNCCDLGTYNVGTTWELAISTEFRVCLPGICFRELSRAFRKHLLGDLRIVPELFINFSLCASVNCILGTWAYFLSILPIPAPPHCSGYCSLSHYLGLNWSSHSEAAGHSFSPLSLLPSLLWGFDVSITFRKMLSVTFSCITWDRIKVSHLGNFRRICELMYR